MRSSEDNSMLADFEEFAQKEDFAWQTGNKEKRLKNLKPYPKKSEMNAEQLALHTKGTQAAIAANRAAAGTGHRSGWSKANVRHMMRSMQKKNSRLMDPVEFMILVYNNSSRIVKTLKSEYQENGGVPIDIRLAAARQVSKYLYPEMKSIELSQTDQKPVIFQVAVKMPDGSTIGVDSKTKIPDYDQNLIESEAISVDEDEEE